MDHDFDTLSQRLEHFTRSHRRQFYPEERTTVLKLYQELVILLEEEAVLTLEDRETSMHITITAKSFLSSKDFPFLQQLIHEAATFEAYINDGMIVFDFYFTFWKWVPVNDIDGCYTNTF